MWSVLYVAGAMLFCGFLYLHHGKESASLFLSGYTLEKVLAFDNLFVFSLILTYFKIGIGDQHKALHYGIIGAVVFRLIFTVIGVSSLMFLGPAMELIFAALIAFSIYLIIKSDENETDYNSLFYVRWLKKVYPGVTTFMIAVAVIEVSDIMFAFDSVPAIIAVTKEPLLIYTSMIFAILGLRSMYFVMASLSQYLEYMDNAVIAVLGFISAKLAIHALTGWHINPNTSLLIILGVLSVGIFASLIKGKKQCLQQ